MPLAKLLSMFTFLSSLASRQRIPLLTSVAVSASYGDDLSMPVNDLISRDQQLWWSLGQLG